MEPGGLASTPLNQNVFDHPLPQSAKSAILTNLLCCNFLQATDQRLLRSLDPDLSSLDTYWAYYSRECINALHDGGRHVATRTHADITACAAKLRSGMVREDIKASLRSKLSTHHENEEEMLDNSIDLTASLLLMANFGSYSYAFSGQNRVFWNQGSLRDFVQKYFEPERKLANETVKLEKLFKASNLDRIAGLQISWTDNLADHLRMTEDDKRVHIFHHASFLEAQRQRLVPSLRDTCVNLEAHAADLSCTAPTVSCQADLPRRLYGHWRSSVQPAIPRPSSGFPHFQTTAVSTSASPSAAD